MAYDRKAVAAARKAAQAAGYYIREGSYQDTTDDRLGRWYTGHEGATTRKRCAVSPSR